MATINCGKGNYMKIKVKQINWSGWDGGSSQEINHEFDVKMNEDIIVDSMKFSSYENGKEIYENKVIFSFKVIKITNKYIKLLTFGEAGGKYSKGRYKPKKVILPLKETIKFNTGWMDAGKNFEISVD